MDKSGLKIAFLGDSLTEGITGASYFEILRQKLPQHELINYGKGGDTVISLYRRLHQIDMDPGLDLGFLWIGVNDVFVKTSWRFLLAKRLRGQPWAKNHTQFQEYYNSQLEFLLDRITHIFTLPPLLIGEDINNDWNKELTVLSKIIRALSDFYPNVEFVDLREAFISQLASKITSPYVSKSVYRVILDALFAKTPEKTEKKAAKRGLHFTIDGVHLNRAGAEKVADVLLEKVRSKLRFIDGDP
ncbi:MAG: SGNH/GDSL hydrolase family protein [Candidatus Aminicenantes bacterium]|nr:MAG: SGNH/GDSL hydrolase family protein [Candidatus Aminicenantes bacterium]